MNSLGIVIVIFAWLSLYIMPGNLTAKVLRCSGGRVVKNGKTYFKKLSLKKTLMSYIPMHQMIVLHKVFYNGRAGYTLYLTVGAVALVIFRLIVITVTQSPVLFLISAVGMFVALLLHQLLYALVIRDVARMVECTYGVVLASWFVPYVTARFVIPEVRPAFIKLYEKKRFEGEKRNAV